MDEETVSNYVERSTSLIESSPQMDEQNTRSRLIDPFIKDVLGWNFYATDIEMEYSVQMGSSKKKVDYALFTDGSPAVFVEAKGCDTTITETHADQLRSYIRQEWVDWGLLTNGKSFVIFRLKKDGDNPDVERLGEVLLTDLTANDWMLAALSKESIQSGNSTELYQRVERRRNAIETLSEQKDSIAESIRETIIERVGKIASQPAESLSKTFVDDLIAELDRNKEESGRSTIQAVEPSRDKQRSDGKYTVQIESENDTTRFAGDTQTEAMAAVVDFLINEHQLIDAISPLPFVPGKKNAMLHDQPVHPTGSEMRFYQEVGDGYYLNANLSKDAKKRQLRRFSDLCDVSITFDGEW